MVTENLDGLEPTGATKAHDFLTFPNRHMVFLGNKLRGILKRLSSQDDLGYYSGLL